MVTALDFAKGWYPRVCFLLLVGESQGKEGLLQLVFEHPRQLLGKRWVWGRCHRICLFMYSDSSPHGVQLALRSLRFSVETSVPWCRSWAGLEHSCLCSGKSKPWTCHTNEVHTSLPTSLSSLCASISFRSGSSMFHSSNKNHQEPDNLSSVPRIHMIEGKS